MEWSWCLSTSWDLHYFYRGLPKSAIWNERRAEGSYQENTLLSVKLEPAIHRSQLPALYRLSYLRVIKYMTTSPHCQMTISRIQLEPHVMYFILHSVIVNHQILYYTSLPSRFLVANPLLYQLQLQSTFFFAKKALWETQLKQAYWSDPTLMGVLSACSVIS